MELTTYLSAVKQDKCPSCGGSEFDLDHNQHQYLDSTATDHCIFSCSCGAIYVETWRLESVLVTDKKFYEWSLK